MCHPANDAAREAVVASVLHFVGLAADALPAVLGTFGVHSQAGDKMQESSAVTMKTIPDEDARKAVGAWAAPLTGQGSFCQCWRRTVTVRLIHDQAYTVEHSATVFVWRSLALEASSPLTVFMITVGPVLCPWPGSTPPISPSTI